MCNCPAHRDLVDCECQCDHTHDRLAQWQARALAAEAEVARLRTSESDEPHHPGTELTPGQWIRRWNEQTADERLQQVTHIRTAFRAWRECEETDHRGRLEHAEGELSARRDHETRWELEHRKRTEAEAAIERVRALHSPRDRGAGPECMGCRTTATFTRYEACRTLAALAAPEATPDAPTEDHA